MFARLSQCREKCRTQHQLVKSRNGEQMFYIPIERELLDEELWSVRPSLKLPMKIQLLVQKDEVRQDIWELSPLQLNSIGVNR